MKPIHLFLMICTVAVWGFNFVATRVALEVFSPAQMAFARSILTLVILLPWWKPFKPISRKLLAAAMSIGAVAFYLFYEAIGITESLTTVAVGTQLFPPLSALLALLFFQERISPRKWLGILIATTGAIYLTGATTSMLSVTALGLTFLAILFYSGGSIIIGKTTSVSVWRMLAWISAISLIPLGVMTATTEPLYPELGLMQVRHWLALPVCGGSLRAHGPGRAVLSLRQVSCFRRRALGPADPIFCGIIFNPDLRRVHIIQLNAGWRHRSIGRVGSKQWHQDNYG